MENTRLRVFSAEGAEQPAPQTMPVPAGGALTDQRLQELSKDKTNEVYHYTYDEPTRVVPALEVRAIIEDLYRDFQKLWPTKKVRSDADLRIELGQREKRYREFAGSHPRIYVKLTDRFTTLRDVRDLLFLVSLRQKVERGEADDNAARGAVSEYGAKRFLRDATPHERKEWNLPND